VFAKLKRVFDMGQTINRYAIPAICLGVALYFQQTEQMVICFLWIGAALAYLAIALEHQISACDRREENNAMWNSISDMNTILQNEIRDLRRSMNEKKD